MGDRDIDGDLVVPHVAQAEPPQRIVSDLARVGRAATQARNAQDGVRRRATGTLVSGDIAQGLQHTLLGRLIDQRHHALGESE